MDEPVVTTTCDGCGGPLVDGHCDRCERSVDVAFIHREIVTLILLTAVVVAGFFLTRAVAHANRDLRQRDASAWYDRGERDLASGHTEVAITALRRATAIDRGQRPYQFALAGALAAAGQDDAARQVLLGIREASPEDPEINLRLARLDARSNNLTGAVRYYQNALYGVWSGEQETVRRHVRIELIQYLLAHGQHGRALSELLVLSANLPDDVASQTQAGRLYLSAGEPRRALEHFQRALDAEPKNQVAVIGAGQAAFEEGDYANAQRYLRSTPRSAAVSQTREITDLGTDAGSASPRTDTCRTPGSPRHDISSRDGADRRLPGGADCQRPGSRRRSAVPPRRSTRFRTGPQSPDASTLSGGDCRRREPRVPHGTAVGQDVRRAVVARSRAHSDRPAPRSRSVDMAPSFSPQQLRLREHQLFLALTIVVGVLAGLSAVLFTVAIERTTRLLFGLDPSAVRFFLVPVVVSVGTGALLTSIFPDVRGSGVPQTEAAYHLRGGIIPWRVPLGKFLTGVLCIGSGHSMGREGPSVQIGAGLASVIGQWVPLSPARIKDLVPVGAAGALAAAFNTPVAAVLFALEEIIGDMNASLLGSAVVASVASVVVERSILGNEPLFRVPEYHLQHPAELLAYAALGIVGGIVSVVVLQVVCWASERGC